MSTVRHTDKRFLELLEKWLGGDFSRADEQELYRLAQKDEFRQEALEGFRLAPEETHEERLQRLKRKINPDRRLVPGTFWWAAAAVSVTILAAVWFFRSSDQSRLPGSEAVAVETPPSEPDQTISSRPDTSADLGNLAATEEVRQTREEASAKKRPAPSASKPDFSTKPEAISAAPAEVQAETDGPGKRGGIYAAEDRVMRVTPRAMSRPDSQAYAPASRTTVQPAMGWAAFRKYASRLARLNNSALNNNVSGSVRLQFQVGADSLPYNIVFLKKLGYGLDEEAVRIVKSVRWQPAQGSVEVDIPFVH